MFDQPIAFLCFVEQPKSVKNLTIFYQITSTFVTSRASHSPIHNSKDEYQSYLRKYFLYKTLYNLPKKKYFGLLCLDQIRELHSCPHFQMDYKIRDRKLRKQTK